MPTLLRCYSQRQTNRVFCGVVEFLCAQFHTLHRKPFLLQMCGAVASILDNNNNDFEINPMTVKAKVSPTIFLFHSLSRSLVLSLVLSLSPNSLRLNLLVLVQSAEGDGDSGRWFGSSGHSGSCSLRQAIESESSFTQHLQIS